MKLLLQFIEKMISPGNNVIEAELSLHQTAKMSQTQALQQLHHTQVILVIL